MLTESTSLRHVCVCVCARARARAPGAYLHSPLPSEQSGEQDQRPEQYRMPLRIRK